MTTISSLPQKSTDRAVQGTNDDSVQSKRSAVRAGYFRDPFLRAFTANKAPRKRSPIINRGYYLRMKVMDAVVGGFLNALSSSAEENKDNNNNKIIQVLSLGAGFDTFACRHYDSFQQSAHFFEVDFPSVMQRKVALMMQHKHNTLTVESGRQQQQQQQQEYVKIPFLLTSPEQKLETLKSTITANEEEGQDGDGDDINNILDKTPRVSLSAPRFKCIGCDLRDTASLTSLLSNKVGSSNIESSYSFSFSFDAPTIVYAECCTQYMPSAVSTNLLQWCSSSLKNAVYIGYDQINRDHPGSVFGKAMMSTLKSRSSPLLGTATEELRDCSGLARRAEKVGFENVRCVDFSAVSRWVFSSSEEFNRIKSLEPFDEHEEWAVKCSHYALLMAVSARRSPWFDAVVQAEMMTTMTERGGGGGSLSLWSGGSAGAAQAATTEKSTCSSSPHPAEAAAICSLCPIQTRSGVDGTMNATASMQLLGDSSNNTTLILSFGGMMQQQQQQQQQPKKKNAPLSIFATNESVDTIDPVRVVVVAESHQQPKARMCATLTRLVDGDDKKVRFLLAGGRNSPTSPIPVDDAFWLLVVEDVSSSSSGAAAAASSSSSPLSAQHEHEQRRHITVSVRWTKLLASSSSSSSSLTGILPRYRHVAAATSSSSVFIAGGCGAKQQEMLRDVWAGRIDFEKSAIEWRCTTSLLPIGVASPQLVPLSAQRRWLLSGGLTSNGDAISSAASLVTCSPHDDLLSVTPCRPADEMTAKQLARFSGTVIPLPEGDDKFLLLGGIRQTVHQNGGVPCDPESDTVAVVSVDVKTQQISATVSKSLTMFPQPDQLSAANASAEIIRCHVAELSSLSSSSPTRSFLLFGGGHGCFSFGSFLAKPKLLRVGGPESQLRDSKSQQQQSTTGFAPAAAATAASSSPSFTLPPIPNISSAQIFSELNESTLDKAISQMRVPVLFRSNKTSRPLFDTSKWSDPEHLKRVAGADRLVSVHCAANRDLDFVNKNFRFSRVRFGELVDHCWNSASSNINKEIWYLRAVGDNMHTDRANFWRDFPALANDMQIPPVLRPFCSESSQDHHQSVLRVNQRGMLLWPHVDTLDNFLLHAAGPKRVVFFPPHLHHCMYPSGTSSRVTGSMDAPNLAAFPKFLEARLAAFAVDLEPGDVLFIPNLWYHRIECESNNINNTLPFAVSVNIFFRRFAIEEYDKKDLYGNKMLPAAVEAKEKAIAAVKEALGSGIKDPEFRRFALAQLIDELMKEG